MTFSFKKLMLDEPAYLCQSILSLEKIVRYRRDSTSLVIVTRMRRRANVSCEVVPVHREHRCSLHTLSRKFPTGSPDAISRDSELSPAWFLRVSKLQRLLAETEAPRYESLNDEERGATWNGRAGSIEAEAETDEIELPT